MALKYPLIFVDVETTHLFPSVGEIVDIAIITEDMDGVVSKFNTKITPVSMRDADPKALEINGYNETDWKGAPLFKDVAWKVAQLLNNGTIIGHNVNFDVAFIKGHLRRAGITSKISHHQFDTRMLMAEHSPTRSTSLKTARMLFGLSEKGSHTALVDVIHCRHVFHMLFQCGWWRRMWLFIKYQMTFEE
jgi:DNA polymerase-3 subunit epsilon